MHMKTRIQVVLGGELEQRFREELVKRGFKKGDISEEIESLIRQSLEKVSSKVPLYKENNIQEIDDVTKQEIESFYEKINTFEKELGRGLLILKDKKALFID